MYSRDQIQQVRSAVDIVDVIREYVPSLKVAGRSVRGLCPFHGEKTPSFHVHPEKGFFKCFGCGVSGDIIEFLTQIEQVSFTEALERLAKQAGVYLKKDSYQAQKREETVKEKLYRVLEAALIYYEEQLQDDRGGEAAKSYLESRGVKDETIEKFRLGCAPEAGESCFEALVKKGFSIDLCQQAGLAARSKAGRYYDPLFGRLIFPIIDNFGHVVGFGGRVLPESKKKIFEDDDSDSGQGPKYINSPDSPVFSKGKLLYGLYLAKPSVMAKRRVVVLEGYMDVIGAHQCGFTQAVATLGTALTRDHTKLLKRYADEVVAFFDPDEAGQKASLRGLEPILQESLYPRLVRTEGALDPDEFILEKGAEAFNQLIDSAPDFIDHVLESFKKSENLSLQEKAQFAQRTLRIISQSPNEILKSEWINRISRSLGLEAGSLKAELNKIRKPQSPSPTMVRKEGSSFRLPSGEEEYLQLVINCRELWGNWGLQADDFTEAKAQKIFGLIKNQIESQNQIEVQTIHDELSPDEKKWFLWLTLEEKDFTDPQSRKDQLIRDIRIKKQKKRLAYLSQQVRSGAANTQERDEYHNLLKQIKGSSRTLAAH